MTSLDDETELIKGLKEGDQLSYKKLVEAYWIELNFLASKEV
jgi:hypothetical protein